MDVVRDDVLDEVHEWLTLADMVRLTLSVNCAVSKVRNVGTGVAEW